MLSGADAVLVSEASIIAGLRMLLDHAGLVAEPSAALGIAAILEDRDRFAGRHVVTIGGPSLTVNPSIDVEYWRTVDGQPVRDGSYWHGWIKERVISPA